MEFDAKGMPKWNQHRCQNSSKIDAKSGNDKKYEKHDKNHVFCMVQSCKFIVKAMFFEGLTGFVRKRKRYQTNIENDTNIPKSMKSQCGIYEK